MPDRPDSRRIAMLDCRGPLAVALERRARIRAALTQAKANGFAVGRLRADLRAIEAEVRQLQAREGET